MISVSTTEDNRPSKYQQIKWIVSRQLITLAPIPRSERARQNLSVHLHHQKMLEKANSVNQLIINSLPCHYHRGMNLKRRFAFEKITPQMDKMSTLSTRSATLSLWNDGHLAELGNSVGQRGVRAEKGR